MVLYDKEFDFPAINKVSFHKLIESLETMAEDSDDTVSTFAKQLLKETEAEPLLKEGFEDYSLLEKHKDLIQKLSRVLFPEALQMNEIKGLTPPFQFVPFYTSTRFRNILNNAGEDFSLKLDGFEEELFYRVGCTTILSVHFGYHVDLRSKPFVFEIPNVKTGESRFYRLAFNADLMEILPTENSKDISKEEYLELLDNFDNIDLWREKFPPNSWLMKGIGIMNLMDVTMDQSIISLTSNLLVKTNDTLLKIQNNIRTLFGINDLKLGFIAYEDNSFVQTHKAGSESLLLGKQESSCCDGHLCGYGYDVLINQRNPLAISDVDKYHKLSNSDMAVNLKKEKVKSYLLVPLIHQEEFLGFLEIASFRKYELNNSSIKKLQDILPILSMAASRFKEEAKNRIEAIIQEECTTIHSSVKWRFEEEAKKYMNDQQNDIQGQFDDIVFKDVYPLYGQVDIKSSSSKRNNAVILDLVHQLNEVKSILNEALKVKELLSYDELIFRIDSYIKEIEDGLMAGSEHKIQAFLRSEIYPIFDHIQKSEPQLSHLIEKYNGILSQNMDIIYEARRDFDESVTKTNLMLASYIDNSQIEAQKMFPHYFERYKTDGVEFNMYIGQSIAKNEKFNLLYLKNLRLSQLITMINMEREFRKLQSELSTPLEVASLILVYNTPLNIHFRMDEKRFDVEGAYNARYEIVKKRVDKAHIMGTDERITIPGKIAIIYTSRQDELEYMKYIKFLEAKGYLIEGSAENHQLENLQGITGLKALRVSINYAEDRSKKESYTYEELVKSIND